MRLRAWNGLCRKDQVLETARSLEREGPSEEEGFQVGIARAEFGRPSEATSYARRYSLALLAAWLALREVDPARALLAIEAVECPVVDDA